MPDFKIGEIGELDKIATFGTLATIPIEGALPPGDRSEQGRVVQPKRNSNTCVEYRPVGGVSSISWGVPPTDYPRVVTAESIPKLTDPYGRSIVTLQTPMEPTGHLHPAFIGKIEVDTCCLG